MFNSTYCKYIDVSSDIKRSVYNENTVTNIKYNNIFIYIYIYIIFVLYILNKYNLLF